MKSLLLFSEQAHLACELKVLGEFIRRQRIELGLRLVDVSAGVGVSTSVLSRLESGKIVRTDSLFKVLNGLGLTMGVRGKNSSSSELHAAGLSVGWHEVERNMPLTRERPPVVEPEMDRLTPTLFLSFDGALHIGHGVMHDGVVSLDSGRAAFEFAPLLVELLRPYPQVEIVLTTGWLQSITVDEVIYCLPPDLASRVVGTTRDFKPRLSYVQSGAGRTDVIVSYAYAKRLKNWLAIDDEAFGAYKFGYEPGAFVDHFLLLNPERGISDIPAQENIRRWLELAHQQGPAVSGPDGPLRRDTPTHEKRTLCASQLKNTPPQTSEEIGRLMAEGRFAEMTPRLAGCDDED